MVKKRNPVQLEVIKDKLRLLRHFAGGYERGFHGVEEVTAYLKEIGVQTAFGKPPGPNTVRNWINNRGFPNCTIHKDHGVFVTNLQILAWLWSIKTWQKTRPRRSK